MVICTVESLQMLARINTGHSSSGVQGTQPVQWQPRHPTGVARSTDLDSAAIFPGGVSLREKPIRFRGKFHTVCHYKLLGLEKCTYLQDGRDALGGGISHVAWYRSVLDGVRVVGGDPFG